MNPARPELGATLDHICLQSAQPHALAAFIEKAYAMRRERDGDGWRCTAPGRTLLVRPGKPNRVAHVAFAFDDPDRIGRGASEHTDPDGNLIVFKSRDREEAGDEPLPARLQHLAFRTPRLDEMVAFYESIGFVVSDRVKDDDGVLRACFLRTDAEHHALALFRANEARFDHLSCETRDIGAVVAWADRMAAAGIPIHWGIGRHGPGNDVFFMVKDPDGNLLEISAEIEQCDAARPAGTWRHEQRTLNLWGNAIMRS